MAWLKKVVQTFIKNLKNVWQTSQY